MPYWKSALPILLLLSGCTPAPEHARILSARTLPGVDGLHLELTQDIELTQAMRDALDHGIALRLVYRIRVCEQPREITLDGPGLPEGFGIHWFESYSTKPCGTGLGLAIVAKITQEHGTHFAAQRREEGGTMVALCPSAG